ncbi:MAG: hypothetical protein ACI4EF_08205 [Coprococcus sp.]
MPGYMFHLAEGQLILNKLNISSDYSSSFIHDFMLGCSIPDATSNKDFTHFRPIWQKELITKYPDIDYFLNTYESRISTACDFGILAHLQLDNLYVASYWKEHFCFEDKTGHETLIHKNIHHVRMLKNNYCIPYNEFFSDKYFYGDYDICNPYIYNDVHPCIPNDYHISPDKIHIAECKNYDEHMLSDDINKYVLSDITQCDNLCINKPDSINSQHNQGMLTTPLIFPYESMLSFLETSANKYINLLAARNLFSKFAAMVNK